MKYWTLGLSLVLIGLWFMAFAIPLWGKMLGGILFAAGLWTWDERNFRK